MRIGNINSVKPAFKGIVFMNYNKMATQIDDCPEQTQEALISNIKSLKDKLQTQTPDYKTYLIDFDYKKERKYISYPTVHSIAVSVTDKRNNFVQREILLGKTDGFFPEDEYFIATDDEIWEKCFKDVTEESLGGMKSKKNTDGDYAKLKRVLHARQLYGLSDYERTRAIYDKIEDRSKVDIDKITTAVTIHEVTKGACTSEVLDSILGNINTLTWRLETETDNEKKYDFIIDNELGKYNTKITTPHKYYPFAALVRVCTNGKEEQSLLKTRSYDKNNSCFYCITDPERVWQEGFKQITENILEDAHTNLPFDNDARKREIVNRLL